MSRLDDTFVGLQGSEAPGLVTYVTAGDPDTETSVEILAALAAAGADVLEVGVPFSDPLADGPVIQRATERALAGGMTLRGTIDLVRRVRNRTDTPVVLFTYANPVVRMDPREFARLAADAGVDGVLILDLPVEEADSLRAPIVDAGLDPIFLISPTTSNARITRSGELGRGFLYVISRLGVTGARERVEENVEALVARVRTHARLPVALGFGISRPEHVARVCEWADAAVVGSALVDVIAGSAPSDAPARAAEYVRLLKGSR